MHSIIATFDDHTTAQSAVDSLIARGFYPENVHLQAAAASPAASTPRGRSSGSDKGFLTGVGNFFSHLFESEDTQDAGKYAEAVRRGSSVVIVDARSDEDVEKATDVMDDMGAVDVEERAETWKAQGWTGFDADAEYTDKDAAFARQAVPVVQEALEVGKRSVNVGGLRVVKRLSEKPVSEIVKLREEHATIERHPVDRAATEADFSNFKEGTIEVRETAEQAVVGKTARVVEEVVIGKTVSERSQTVSETLRRTDVDVERMPGDPTARNDQTRKL